jgi:hypothetical protein
MSLLGSFLFHRIVSVAYYMYMKTANTIGSAVKGILEKVCDNAQS